MKVGQKVVCIKSAKSYYDSSKIIKDNIYTVYKIFEVSSGIGLVVEEREVHGGWSIENFRPLITDHTFTNEVTKELANEPLIQEGIEELEKELI